MPRTILSVPNIVVGLLTTTAALKVYSAVDTANLPGAPGVSRWLVISGVQVEVFLAAWLLSRWKPFVSWLAATFLFLIFGSFSLYRAVVGYDSCGCFGQFKVDPWWTFVIDVGIVVMLLVRHNEFLENRPKSSRKASVLPCAVGYVVVAIFAQWLMMSGIPVSTIYGASGGSDGTTLVLNPAD